MEWALNGAVILNPNGTIEYASTRGFVGADACVIQQCSSAPYNGRQSCTVYNIRVEVVPSDMMSPLPSMAEFPAVSAGKKNIPSSAMWIPILSAVVCLV
jgi:hypothetical protein